MVKNLKLMSSSFMMALTLGAPQLSHAMDTLPDDILVPIVKKVSYEGCLENINPAELASVSKRFKFFITQDMQPGKPSWKAWYSVEGNEQEYEAFLNLNLIIRPNLNNDQGIIIKKVRDLKNPLQGKFDISESAADQNWCISTGYRNKQNPANVNKYEVWITPWFLFNKQKNAGAKHLQLVETGNFLFGKWDGNKAPIAFFFNWGGLTNNQSDCYGYHIHNTPSDVCTEGLLKIFSSTMTTTQYDTQQPNPMGQNMVGPLAHISFSLGEDLPPLIDFNFPPRHRVKAELHHLSKSGNPSPTYHMVKAGGNAAADEEVVAYLLTRSYPNWNNLTAAEKAEVVAEFNKPQ